MTKPSILRPYRHFVDTWSELTKTFEALLATPGSNWLFRGLGNSDWGLKTSLERVIERYWPDHDFPSLTTETSIESGLIRQFMRQLHNHAPLEIPGSDNPIERLAIMQHHGAPTRLLDWSYSPYVAAFFAVEPTKGPSAIWAIDRTVLDGHRKAIIADTNAEECVDSAGGIRDSPECFEALFERPFVLVSPVNPIRLTQRLVIQQGIFLCPGDVSQSFEANLAASLGEVHAQALRKIVITGDAAARRGIMTELHRMNMNRAVLFPGLDGFSASLNALVADPDLIRLVRDIRTHKVID